jgi:hypothetical protein
MALPKFSFTVITQEELDARRKEAAVAATKAALHAKPPRQFSAPVGVVSKLKKKSSCLQKKTVCKQQQAAAGGSKQK